MFSFPGNRGKSRNTGASRDTHNQVLWKAVALIFRAKFSLLALPKDAGKGLAIVFRFLASTRPSSVPYGENASEPRVIFAFIIIIHSSSIISRFLSSVYYFRVHCQSHRPSSACSAATRTHIQCGLTFRRFLRTAPRRGKVWKA